MDLSMDCLTGFFDFDVYFFSEYGSSKRELQLILNGISVESLWISKEDFGTSRMSRMVFKLCHNFLMISPKNIPMVSSLHPCFGGQKWWNSSAKIPILRMDDHKPLIIVSSFKETLYCHYLYSFIHVLSIFIHYSLPFMIDKDGFLTV